MNTIPTTARYKCRNWSLNKTTGETTPSQCGRCTYLQYEFWNVLPFKNVETLYRRFHVQNAYTFSKKKKERKHPKKPEERFILQSVRILHLPAPLPFSLVTTFNKVICRAQAVFKCQADRNHNTEANLAALTWGTFLRRHRRADLSPRTSPG